jgi:uncharacterized protein (DUF58 family)
LVWVFLVLWLPLSAAVTGNNFLYMIFGMAVGLGLVSHRLAMRNINSVKVVRRFPDEIFAETPFTISYNAVGAADGRGATTLRLQEQAPLLASEQSVDFLRVLTGETTRGSGVFSLPSRGDIPIEAGIITSSFPFGLATYSRKCGSATSVLVFPKIEQVAGEIPFTPQGAGSSIERVDPYGTVPFQFRDYISGDPHKHIDWKKSARVGELITRVLSDEGAREVLIRLTRDADERAISRAASLVVHFGGQGVPVGLEGPGLAVEAGTGGAQTRKLLTILALWENSDEELPPRDDSLKTVVEVDRYGEFGLIGPGASHDHV